jgi:hypothetical protein
LIGVISRPGQTGIVEEFFELFKTPWEKYRPGRAYDVIVATADEIPEIKPKLLLIYSASRVDIDSRFNVSSRKWGQGATLNHRGTAFPIYGEFLTFPDGAKGDACVTAKSGSAGLTFDAAGSTVVRVGYDLFEEVRFLLSVGQPIEHAHIPTLDIHISMLRDWILEAGISLLEIPPAPAGYSFSVCLTHDIDFVGIRNHKFDHSMWGFLYRGTLGTLLRFFRGRISALQLLKSWRAVASLPFVYAGWAKDFWEPFEWYMEAEKGLPATYFLIPFKRRSGEKVPGRRASLRATAYDISDLRHWTTVLLKNGCELGVHGIDAWHSLEKAREELARINGMTGNSETGIRMHWLLRDANTPSTLERAGYAYDSTVGYNETIGYRAGTSQVVRPVGTQTILELPLHIQDGALFYPQRLDLSEAEAEKRCHTMIDNASRNGGALTVLWHDRSHGPERFWGGFYIKLVQALKASNAWFATGAQAVGWFRKRRHVQFEFIEAFGVTRIRLHYEGGEIQPPLKIRLYKPKPRHEGTISGLDAEFVELPWNGKSVDQDETQILSRFSVVLPEVVPCLQS